MAATSANAFEGAQSDVVAFLTSGKAFGRRPQQIKTHAARIFLAGDRAWKLKRAVRYPYLDFSTLEQRHAILAAELALNRRTAPHLYVGLTPVMRTADGALHIGGPGEPLEWLLEMRRFPQQSLFSELAEHRALGEDRMIRLADQIVGFHQSAEWLRGNDGADRIRAVIAGNRDSLARYPQILPSPNCKRLIDRQLHLLARYADLLDARAQAGRIRHCHGDLHLGNIVLIDGEPTLFDCLEFDSQLATIDVLYDLAFLLMDLWERDLHAQANLVMNRYLDRSAEDENGIALIPLLMSIRATIRAHVCAATAANGDDHSAGIAKAYLDLAAALLADLPVALIALGGLSGTGKSTIARALAAKVGASPGARIIRTDIIRKRLAGVSPETRLARATYTRAASHAAYTAALTLARQGLSAGCSIIVDAVFAEAQDRAAVRSLAAATGAHWLGLWLEAPLAKRLERIRTRSRDASDADVAVARQQKSPAADQLLGWHRVNATGPIPHVAEDIGELIQGVLR